MNSALPVVPATSSSQIVARQLLNLSGTGPSDLVQSLLREQQTLTAVERFSRMKDTEPRSKTGLYRDLIPLDQPRPGQQYAFEVDLDMCTGCKACVAACHSLNGLDESESWRSVGFLHGGTEQAPAQQTVTTSCHHCIDPACMSGCPVKAYEKDPVTGIVKHLDDQCIGCKYCTLMCPYDAPKYNDRLGIVRKCDMCSDRLAGGEAPACVGACPNGAIRIKVIDQVAAIQASEANSFLPGAPAPDHTTPTTSYRTRRGLPGNMLPADFYSVGPESSHLPLVFMLVLTQMAAGAFATNALLSQVLPLGLGGAMPQTVLALSLAFVALGASLFHLGRPQHAWKAFLGLRTSWLSREIIAFGVFAKLGLVYALTTAPIGLAAIVGEDVLRRLSAGLGVGAGAVGLVGVLCSVMVYAATKRAHWGAGPTGVRFLLTTAILGPATVSTILILWYGAPVMASGGLRPLRVLLLAALAAAVIKLLFDALALRHRGSRKNTVLRRMAMVMTGDLARITLARFVCGTLGGVVVPALMLVELDRYTTESFSVAFRVGAIVAVVLALVGELLERVLFFSAAPPSRMPGGLN